MYFSKEGQESSVRLAGMAPSFQVGITPVRTRYAALSIFQSLTRVVEMVSVWSHTPRLGVRIPHPQVFFGPQSIDSDAVAL